MAMIIWDSYLEVGHPIMDEQHRILADVLNQLHTATRENKGRRAIGDLLLLFRESTEIHYRFEEDLMERSHYSAAADHTHLHHVLLGQLDAMVQGHENGSLEVTSKLLHSLQDWLVSHIVKEDLDLGRFMRRQKRLHQGLDLENALPSMTNR